MTGLLTGSAIRALHKERVAGCSHGNRVHGGGRWSGTVGKADWDTAVRNHPEGDLGQHASEQAGETPRMLVGIISMLENLVVSESSSVYHRISAWWILV